MKRIIILLFICVSLTGRANIIHVTTTGTSSGDGSINNPVDLHTAIDNENQQYLVQPGDTVLIHGGVYKGAYENQRDGTAENYIVFMPYNGETVVIDGDITANYPTEIGYCISDQGSYCEFRNLILTHSDANRISLLEGSWPEDIKRVDGINGGGAYCRYINLIIHNVSGNAYSSWEANKQALLYGCVIYNGGWKGADRSHGWGLYQNNNGEAYGWKNVRNNIIFNMHGGNYKIYGQSGMLNSINVYDNISFNSAAPASNWGIQNMLVTGSGGAIHDIIFKRNYIYQDERLSAGGLEVSGGSLEGFNFEIDSNIIYTPVHNSTTITISHLCNSSFQYNTAYGTNNFILYFPSVDSLCDTQCIIDNNDYYFLEEHDLAWKYKFAAYRDETGEINFDHSFNEWTTYFPTYDQNTSYTEAEPTFQYSRVIPNDYEKRANAVVYNSLGLDSVNLDVSEVFTSGDSVYIYDVEQIWEPVVSTVYTGDSILVPMKETNVSLTPLFSRDIQHTDSLFNAFLILNYKIDDLGMWTNAALNDIVAPTAPNNLTAEKTDTTITLTWDSSNDSIGVYAYLIYKGGVKIDSIGASAYTDTGLTPETEYTYEVYARDLANNISDGSGQLQVTTLAIVVDSLAPDVPINLQATAISSSQINLIWNASDSSDVTGYRIYRDDALRTTVSDTTYSDTGLDSSTEYGYWLTAIDGSSNVSDSTSTVYATTQSGEIIISDSIKITSLSMLADSMSNRTANDTLLLQFNTVVGNIDLSADSIFIWGDINYTPHIAGLVTASGKSLDLRYVRVDQLNITGDSIYLCKDSIYSDSTSALKIDTKNLITIDSCWFNATDTALFFNYIDSISFTNCKVDSANILYRFPATDWRGKNQNIDNNIYDNDVKFNGKPFFLWRDLFDNIDQNSSVTD